MIKNYLVRVLVVLVLLAAPAQAATRFVNNASGCPGSGSAGSPFCTIQGAVNVANPGDDIQITGGSYTETVSFARQGAQNNVIVVKPKPDTGEVFIKSSSSAGSTSGAFRFLNQGAFWRLEGLHFKDNLTAFAIEIKDSNTGVNFTSVDSRVHDLEIVNCTFTNNGRSQDSFVHTIIVENSRNVTIRDSRFIGNFGVAISLISFWRVTIDNVDITTQKTAVASFGTTPWALGVHWQDGNTWAPGDTSRMARELNLTNSHIHNFTGTGSLTIGIWCDRGGATSTIANNVVDNVGAIGIYNESRCANNIYKNNLSINNDVGFDTPGTSVLVTIGNTYDGNVAWNNVFTGFALGRVDTTLFKNNIALDNGATQIVTTVNAVSGNTYRNNLWFSSTKSTVASWGCTLDGNGSDGLCHHNTSKINQTLKTPSQWIALSGETGGVFANPLFTNPSGKNFVLLPTSPAIDAGVSGVDMGIFPGGQTTPPPTVCP